MAPTRAKDPESWQYGYVTEGLFPEHGGSGAQILWLAFAPTGRVAHAMAHKTPEVLHDYTTNDVTASLHFEDLNGLSVPSIVWFAPGYNYHGTNRANLVGYTNGYLAAEFRVLGATDLSEQRVPVRFELASFAPRLVNPFTDAVVPAKDRLDVRRVELLVGTVTNVQEVGPPKSFLPVSVGRLTISDWRFQSKIGQEMNYVTTNATPSTRQWLPADHTFLQDYLLRYRSFPAPTKLRSMLW